MRVSTKCTKKLLQIWIAIEDTIVKVTPNEINLLFQVTVTEYNAMANVEICKRQTFCFALARIVSDELNFLMCDHPNVDQGHGVPISQ